MAVAGSFTRAFAIVPSDTVPLTAPCDAIYVGGAGDVTVKMTGDTSQGGVAGTAVTFKAPPVGTMLQVKPRLVMVTGTTATLLIGLSRG